MDPEFKTQLLDFALSVRDRVECLGNTPFKGKTVSADNLHMTLSFLGSVDETLLPEVLAIGDRIRLPAFDVVLDQWLVWRRANVAVLAATETPAPLVTFLKQLNGRLAALGISVSQHRYHAHVTLFRRLRLGAGQRADLGTLDTPFHFCPHRFVLLESVPVRGGVEYHILGEWPIG